MADRLEEVRLWPMPQFELLHPPLLVRGQRVVHREQIYPDRVATLVRNDASVENAERGGGAAMKDRCAREPCRRPLRRILDVREHFRPTRQAGNRIDAQHTELRRERNVLLGGQVLPTKEQHPPVQQRAANHGQIIATDRTASIDAVHAGSERTVQGLHLHGVGHASSQGSGVLPARMWLSICQR